MAGCQARFGRATWYPPTYQWFDGTSQVYVLGQVPTENQDGEKAFGVPNGDVTSPEAKIYPMKEHRSLSAQHDATGLMIPHSTFTFFTTGSFDEAVRIGQEQEGLTGSFTLVDVHTYQTINHGVEDDANALQCGDCHAGTTAGGPARMDLQADLGYELKGTAEQVCTQCHELEPADGFASIHNEHVASEGIDCSVCHRFSRPERGLSSDISAFQEGE